MYKFLFLFSVLFSTSILNANALSKGAMYSGKQLIKIFKNDINHVKKIMDGYVPKGTKSMSKADRISRYLKKEGYSPDQINQAFLRIARKNNAITSQQEMIEFYKYLKSVDGFGPTIRKVAAGIANQTRGHTQELRLAVASKKQGLKVLNIGKKFELPYLNKATDLDLLVQHRNKKFAIEVKKYKSRNITRNRFEKDFRQIADMAKDVGAQPVLAINNISPNKLAMLRKEARNYDVTVISGTPNRIMKEIKYLK